MNRKKNRSAKLPSIKREREPVPWKYCLLTVFFGLLFASGFFFAAQQHFYSVEYGMQNSRLRGQIDDLRSQNRRLILHKEAALSPYEIKEAATKIGLRSLTVSSLQAVGGDPVFEKVESEIVREIPAVPVKTFLKQEPATRPARETVPKVQKTVKVYERTEPTAPTVSVDKPEAPKTATRSRIIETAAKR